MRTFLQSLDEKVWQAVEIGWTKPNEASVDRDDSKIKAMNFNSRALNALFSAVTNEEFKKISFTKTAKEAWTILQATYEGTKAVKDSKFQGLTMSFEEIKMEQGESFDEFYAKLKDIVNSAFNLGLTIPEPKIVIKVLRSLLERFHAKITAIEDSKDIDQIPLTELVDNLQTYELGLTRIGKSSKSKSMALKAKSSDNYESSNNKDSKMKSYITRQFKKFMKNVNAKGFDKGRKQSSSSQFKNQDRGKTAAKEGGQYIVPSRPKCFECQGFGHMKQECPTYFKTIRKSKALAATLSDTEPDTESDNSDDEGILNTFTTTVNSTEGIVEEVDEEEDSVESKFEKMDEQDDIHTTYAKLYKASEKHEKLYRLATKKLSEVELNREELSTKFDEVNQTIGALRFENNFLAKRTKKLEVELSQVGAQLKKTSYAKLDEMLSFQKSAFDRTGLGYDFSSPNIASSSTIVFVSPANNVNSKNNDVKTVLANENIDNGKSILGAPPKLEQKETRNPRTKKGNNQKSKQKKQNIFHHQAGQEFIFLFC